MKRILSCLLALLMLTLSLTGCSSIMNIDSESAAEEISKTLVAEAGSAGEDVAKTHEDFKDYEYVAVDKQTKALLEVQSGKAGAAIVDYVASIGSLGEGTQFSDLVVEGEGYSEEEYGIAFRKGSDMTARVNEVIRELKADGTLAQIATKYSLQDILLGDQESEPFVQNATDSDYADIMAKGKLVIGITYFVPMNYKAENGELVGFETEFAKAVCAKLGLEPVFQEINWKTKEIELESKNIDCIWNGMTITEERAANMSISIPYMKNKQVKIVKSK